MAHLAGCSTVARTEGTAQKPGRPWPLLWRAPARRRAGRPKSPTGTWKRMPALPGQEEAFAQEVGRKQGEPELRPKGVRESEG